MLFRMYGWEKSKGTMNHTGKEEVHSHILYTGDELTIAHFNMGAQNGWADTI